MSAMKPGIVLCLLSAASLSLFTCRCNQTPNHAPDVPPEPRGPSAGVKDSVYNFVTTATDPDDDRVRYRFDWGDGDTSDWVCEALNQPFGRASHAWCSTGVFLVRSQAADSQELVSEWSNARQFQVGTCWIKSLALPGSDGGESVRLTSDGGYIIAGTAYDESTHGSLIRLVKTDSAGDKTWDKTYSAGTEGLCVQQTADGGYIIVGTASSAERARDVCLVKTDANGDTLWTRLFGGTKDDRGRSVQQTSDGGYIIAGRTKSFGAGALDAWLVKTDASGNELWNRTFGGPSDDWADCVLQNADGGYSIAATTYSYAEFDADVWLIRTDASGNETWNKTFAGKSYETGTSLQQTSDGGYIITGCNAGDLWLVKTDESGSKIWDRTLDGIGTDGGGCVRQTCDGGYIIAGVTGIDWAGFGGDAWVVKTDHRGHLEWDRTYGDGLTADANCVLPTADGGYVVTGKFQPWGGDYDMWLMKIGPNGEGPAFPDTTGPRQ